MTPAPSSASDYKSLTIGQLIGLNLARLYAWCMQLQATGETFAPCDLARMVISTDAMVRSYVRMLASNQLERAGFTFAANAMRTPVWQRAEVGDIPVCTRAPSVRIERAQGCDLNSLAELSDRLQTTIENFERAEALASHLARVIVCALAYLEPEVRTPLVFGETVEPAFPSCQHIAAPQEPWPPPDRAACNFHSLSEFNLQSETHAWQGSPCGDTGVCFLFGRLCSSPLAHPGCAFALLVGPIFRLRGNGRKALNTADAREGGYPILDETKSTQSAARCADCFTTSGAR
ncbi:hypothetical protein [Ponticaulis sp.]|uniref:hypothetical protein n=1 Tax=Ponticaulis sp. TaxID=2020902 RepID=UPI000C55FA4C|nr:hypothetical protein [Ponticaulis sp.]MBN04469.1 hypothetical protein [Ponticaulis sp.]